MHAKETWLEAWVWLGELRAEFQAGKQAMNVEEDSGETRLYGHGATARSWIIYIVYLLLELIPYRKKESTVQ